MLVGAPQTFGPVYMCLAAVSEIGFFYSFWVNRGNRFVQSAMVALMVVFTLPFLSRVNIPDWLFLTWLTLVFLLAVATLFFFIQRNVHSGRLRSRAPGEPKRSAKSAPLK